MNEIKQQIATSEPLDVMAILKNYVALSRKLKKLEEQRKAAYEQFAKAATAIDANGMKIGQAKIILSSKPLVYEFPPRIVKAEEALKEAKAKWKLKHEPVSGGEPLWKVETNV